MSHYPNKSLTIVSVSSFHLSNPDFLSKLPHEIALYTIELLPTPRDLVTVSRVCKHWRRLSEEPAVWRALFYQQPGWDIQPSYLNIASILNWKQLYMERQELDRRWYHLQTRQRSDAVNSSFIPNVARLCGHTDAIYCCCIVPIPGSRGLIVTGSRDHTICVWDGRTHERLDVLYSHSRSVLCLQHQAGVLASGSSDCTAQLWYQKGCTFLKGPILAGHTEGVLDITFCDKYIVTASRDQTLRVWRKNDGFCEPVYREHAASVNTCSAQGNFVVSGAGNGSIHVWNAETGRTYRVIQGRPNGVASVIYTGDFIISGSSDCAISTWRTSTGDLIARRVAHVQLVRALAFDARRALLVSGGWDGHMRLWDVRHLLQGNAKDMKDQPKLLLDMNIQEARVFDVSLDTTRILVASERNELGLTDFGGQGLDNCIFS